MMNNQAGSVLITGASTGIGRACALHLVARGFQVFAGVRSPEDAEQLRLVSGGRVTPVMLDVTDAAQIDAAVATIRAQTNGHGLRALVNNAGIAVPGPLEVVPIDAFRRQLEVNTLSPIAVTQAFLPLLRESSRPATIVNMGSISGRFTHPLFGPYSASKFALEACSDALRIELSPWGIRVVCIEPGIIATPIWDKTLASSLQMLADVSQARLAPYQPLIDMVKATVKPGMGIPPERVARVVGQAITCRRPRARYVIGLDAYGQLVLTHLPTWLRDWLVRLALPPFGDLAATKK
ncbi:SDR family oxidoreductase [Candidatus Chloroploca sp. Khr17]|uniref:SDR family oxidoreductase n=1 Tax=Candidatus Chloroploca sp. Khr17 TaxID=2496869 RepID=UPI00196A6FB9|nr:SDR family oxidoreductase [Candidatus Chloroploca sp. Khr17]